MPVTELEREIKHHEKRLLSALLTREKLKKVIVNNKIQLITSKWDEVMTLRQDLEREVISFYQTD